MVIEGGKVEEEEARVRTEIVNWGWEDRARMMEGPRLPLAWRRRIG